MTKVELAFELREEMAFSLAVRLFQHASAREVPGVDGGCLEISEMEWLRFIREVVPEAGVEPARLAAGDFLATSAFAAGASAVRGLERAFAMVFRPKAPAVRSLHLPDRAAGRAWLGVGSDALASRAFADFDGHHSPGFPGEAQIVQVPCVYRFHHSGVMCHWLKSKFML